MAEEAIYNARMRDQRGFTLVEILAAMLILTLVITMTLLVFVERNRRLQQASEVMLAYQSLANETEYRRRMNFNGLEDQPDVFVSDTAVLAPLLPYTTLVTVKETQPGIKNVRMTILWHDGERKAELEIVRVDTGGSNLW
jgi:prepilin-type N-terminal cleavage/methylation domain-containing protein